MSNRYQEKADKAAYVRGIIINQVILLERIIDCYIAEYFCSDKQKLADMQMLFLGNDRMTFAAKKQIFYVLLKKQHPEVLKVKPKIDAELDEIGKERNNVAHCLLNDIDFKDRNDEDVYLFRFKDKAKMETYSPQRVKKLLMQIQEISEIIESLFRKSV